MKLMYYVLHGAVLLLFGLLTYLAFLALVPPYLIAAIGGYSFLRRIVEETPSRMIPRAALVGTAQALAFIPLAMAEFKLIGIPIDIQSKEQRMVFAYFAVLALAGFVLIAIAITALRKQRASSA
jgi:hypothetical protein